MLPKHKKQTKQTNVSSNDASNNGHVQTRRRIKCDSSKCTGCMVCVLTCSAVHEKVFGPSRARIRVEQKEREDGFYDKAIACQHCVKAPCIEKCPTGALGKVGTLTTVDDEKCDGCGACVEACPFGAIHIDPVRNVAIQCDLCGGKFSCVDACLHNALSVVSSEISNKGSNEGSNTQNTEKVTEEVTGVGGDA